MPYMVMLAGPNGAGKTTFARRLHTRMPEAVFINADEIARSLPPSLTAAQRNLKAGRATVEQLNAAISSGQDIILETNLASRRYLTWIPKWRGSGYEIDLYYLRLPNADSAIARIKRRVEADGHDIPSDDVRRRFHRSLEYLGEYKLIVNRWFLFDSLEGEFEFVLSGENHG